MSLHAHGGKTDNGLFRCHTQGARAPYRVKTGHCQRTVHTVSTDDTVSHQNLQTYLFPISGESMEVADEERGIKDLQ